MERGGQTEMGREDVAASVRYNFRFGCRTDDTEKGLGIPDKVDMGKSGFVMLTGAHTGDGFFGSPIRRSISETPI